MGYIVQVGNAIPFVGKETSVLAWQIEDFCHEECPTFFGDPSKRNLRAPGYGVWDSFCDAVGLTDMFYLQLSGRKLVRKGCIRLTEKHLDLVSLCLTEYKNNMKVKIPPGYQEVHEGTHPSVPEYDDYLARLIWLEWWIRWALSNCKIPALSIL